MRIKVNGRYYLVKADPQTPLLWVIREEMGLTGTKFGCLKGICGSCTVLVGGIAVRSCILPVGEVGGKEVLTVEGIPEEHPVKRAWIEVGVPQCGYCQSGQIMTAYHLLNNNPSPTEEDVLRAFAGNLCRCGTYQRIKRAVNLASKLMGGRR